METSWQLFCTNNSAMRLTWNAKAFDCFHGRLSVRVYHIVIAEWVRLTKCRYPIHRIFLWNFPTISSSLALPYMTPSYPIPGGQIPCSRWTLQARHQAQWRAARTRAPRGASVDSWWRLTFSHVPSTIKSVQYGVGIYCSCFDSVCKRQDLHFGCPKCKVWIHPFCGCATCSPYKRVEARSHTSIHTDTAGKIGCFAAGLRFCFSKKIRITLSYTVLYTKAQFLQPYFTT